MYQYDSKDKTQSEQSKASVPTANKSHMQTAVKIPVQTKSLFNPSLNQENSRDNPSSNNVVRPIQLTSLITNPPLQMQLIPKQERKGSQAIPIKLSEEQERLAPAYAKPNNTGIPLQMKEKFESLSGVSFDDVKVHYNSGKPAQLQALAYTQGNQVYVAPGQERHLGHELGHVVQQKQRQIKPSIYIKNVAINDDYNLEKEADMYIHRNISNAYNLNHMNYNSDEVIQRMPFNAMVSNLSDKFIEKQIDAGVFIGILHALLQVDILENIDNEPDSIETELDFEEGTAQNGSGGAQFVPFANKYVIRYNFNELWNKCKIQLFPSNPDDVALTGEKKAKIATMVLANIQHELTHAAVAHKRHPAGGIQKGDDILKAVPFVRNDNLNDESLVIVLDILEHIREKMCAGPVTGKYISDRKDYMSDKENIEIDSVITDICVLFNMCSPKSVATQKLNLLAKICYDARTGGEGMDVISANNRLKNLLDSCAAEKLTFSQKARFT